MTLRYRCNALSTELPTHMDRWSIVSSFFSGCFFNCLSWKHTARIKFLSCFIRSSRIWFSYFHSHIFHYHRVYHKLTIDHLSMWLGSSVDRALHRYRKVMGSNPVQARIFFRLLFQLLKLKAHWEDQISLMKVSFEKYRRIGQWAVKTQTSTAGYLAVKCSSAVSNIFRF